MAYRENVNHISLLKVSWVGHVPTP